MSLLIDAARPANCSGAMYCGVPANSCAASAAAVAMPKSVMRTLPSPSIITLAGLRSRCSTPRSWAAATPAHSCRATLHRLVLRQPTDAPEQRREILAVDVLHRQETAAVRFAEVVQAADVPVRDLARDAQLVVELRRAARRRRQSPRAGTSAPRADRESDRRRDTLRPCRRGRAARPDDSGRR